MERLKKPVIDAIIERRSLRQYKPVPVPNEAIEQVLSAGIWAPSAHNRQPWRIVVITVLESKVKLANAMGRQLRSDLESDNVPASIVSKDVQRSYERLTQAPVLILLSMSMDDMDTYQDKARAEHEKIMAIQSVAMCGQNILLAAHDLGLGACWMCAPLFCGEVVKDVLQLPMDWQPQGLITMGYPAQVRERSREPLESRLLWR